MTDSIPVSSSPATQGADTPYDAEATQALPGDTPVVERGRTADLDPGFDDEIGMAASAGYEAGSLNAAVDDGQYGMNKHDADLETGLSDPSLLGSMGMGQRPGSADRGGFDDEDEEGAPAAQGYDGVRGDPVSADGMSGSGASYGIEQVPGEDSGPLSSEFGVGAGFANPDEPGLSSDEDTLIDDAALDRAAGGGGGGIEVPPSPGPDIPAPSDQPGYGDDGNDIGIEIPVPQESDIPNPSPNLPGTDRPY